MDFCKSECKRKRSSLCAMLSRFMANAARWICLPSSFSLQPVTGARLLGFTLCDNVCDYLARCNEEEKGMFAKGE